MITGVNRESVRQNTVIGGVHLVPDLHREGRNQLRAGLEIGQSDRDGALSRDDPAIGDDVCRVRPSGACVDRAEQSDEGKNRDGAWRRRKENNQRRTCQAWSNLAIKRCRKGLSTIWRGDEHTELPPRNFRALANPDPRAI